MGELTTRSAGGYLASQDDFYAAIANEANNLKGGGDGKAFMKFDGNDGTYSYGAEDEPLKNGTEMAANLRSYKRGWVIWVDGKVVYEEMVALQDGPQPSKNSLPDHGPYGEEDGPVEQYTIDFRLIDEPYVEMVFQANNVSKRRALAAFLKDFGNSFRNHPGEVPIIALDSNPFEGKTKGGRKVTKYAPKFKIVRWMPETELAALLEGTPDDYDDKPKAVEDKRSRRSRDDEDERPARRSRDDDREEREERSSRRSRDDEPEEREERSSRRAARDDEPEERPARRSRDDEDERPARRSRDEEDERPARRSRDDDREERDERPARRSRDDEDDRDERPTRGRGRDDEDEGEERTERASRGRGRF
ncbi:polyribonucleotide nucleotidyltransferase [Caulobacter phage Ccr5]|nr:polyribonucleotide nucleotidyltransferase [Caulobacter phage Ccr5]